LLGFAFLYSLNFFVLEKMGMPYRSTLPIKSSPYASIFIHACALTVLYVCVFGILSKFSGYRVEVSISVYYGLVGLLCAVHTHLPGHENRSALFRLIRLMLFPGTSVTFAEVVLADALTSVSKVLKDFGMSLVVVYAYFFMEKDVVVLHNSAMIFVALLASVPYW
jgi:hypothetical protein